MADIGTQFDGVPWAYNTGTRIFRYTGPDAPSNPDPMGPYAYGPQSPYWKPMWSQFSDSLAWKGISFNNEIRHVKFEDKKKEGTGDLTRYAPRLAFSRAGQPADFVAPRSAADAVLGEIEF